MAGLLLLLAALGLFAGVIAGGVWVMLRWEGRLAEPSDSVLSQWLQERRGS